MLRKIANTDEEKRQFLLFFLRDDEELSVEVAEASHSDFEIVKRHLENRFSVFNTYKRSQNPN